MSDFAYTPVTGKIGPLLTKVRETGVPERATHQWLKQVGFTSSNDRTLIRVLEQMHFVDSNRVPTELWRKYRGANHQTVLAEAIRKGYSELYGVYPKAHELQEPDLRNFFSTRTTSGARVVAGMVGTFKALVAHADFSALQEEGGIGQERPHTGDVSAADQGVMSLHRDTAQNAGDNSLSVAINIQLTLPESKDDEVYDKFFAALKRHLMSE